MTTTIRESGAAAPQRTGPGRVKLRILDVGSGSSGRYDQETLEASAANRALPRGTQVHLNHDSSFERQDRPEGDLRNLVGVLLEDAHVEGDALVAEARIGSAWRDFVDDFGEFIGVSINAEAEIVNEGGERVVKRLIPNPFNRADLVTVPGRGGRISEVLESARVIEAAMVNGPPDIVQESATVATYIEARTHQYLSDLFADMYGDGRLSRPEWDTLQAAAGNAVATITSAIAALPDLTARSPWDDAPTLSPAAEAGAAPTDPAGDHPTTGTTTQEVTVPKIEIDSEELQTLRESAGRADTLAQENTQLKEAAEARETEAREARVDAAEAVIREAYGDDAPAFIVEAAKTAAAAGAFDEKAAREAAQALQAREAGKPAGLGHATEGGTTKHTNADILAALNGEAA